jgi:hypothetical protein
MPNQEQATAMVWSLYGKKDSPPQLEWITGKDLNCDMLSAVDGGNGGNYGFLYAGVCRGGLSYPGLSQVALQEGEAFSASSLSHEYWHQALLLETGNMDPLHTNPGFGLRYGFSFGIVDQANEDLANAGM